ncbi:DNA-3-methyladenine glycosylase I [Pedobacter sp.]|uniref:DNA-3-methyladenine glycosylase I n=1 Tax=Pedobacter sp. TaxID=1411316 RepID=UPI002B7EBCBC|nr:DNA-3-methyladenine glycosylase I [Pedobacter sp.]HWW39199.1 DNA-3-methyladenine glycosylase I [Pedobacter sp.]
MSDIKSIVRCPWSLTSELMIKYHDEEWGVPLRDDRRLFEFILLDSFQAGLSFNTILNKRENFRKAFDNFDPQKIARYSDKRIEKLLNNAGIVRNKLKITGTINNARKFIEIQKEYGSFDKFIWQFTNDKTIKNSWQSVKKIPSRTAQSDAMSKALIEKGFKFVGTKICYAFMQAAGMVNDHLVGCYRYKSI